MDRPDTLTGIAWRKSSRSTEQGTTCVEVAEWRKSARSTEQGTACVEVAEWSASA
ncbi:DUF397 domain-containing protein [Actinoallomurus acanthiterrae]